MRGPQSFWPAVIRVKPSESAKTEVAASAKRVTIHYRYVCVAGHGRYVDVGLATVGEWSSCLDEELADGLLSRKIRKEIGVATAAPGCLVAHLPVDLSCKEGGLTVARDRPVR
jgi:hypothetical protein